MSEKKVLDSYAILAYLNRERGYAKVKGLLASNEALLLMNEINLGETFYVVARARGMKQAEYFINTILDSLPIRKVSNGFGDVLEAARIKARYAIAYADCFAVATALREGAPIVTGDPEFRKIEDIVQVEWIGPRSH